MSQVSNKSLMQSVLLIAGMISVSISGCFHQSFDPNPSIRQPILIKQLRSRSLDPTGTTQPQNTRRCGSPITTTIQLKQRLPIISRHSPKIRSVICQTTHARSKPTQTQSTLKYSKRTNKQALLTFSLPLPLSEIYGKP